MKRTISVKLSEHDIDRAIKEVEAYKRELLKKVEILRDRIAERIAAEAQSGFNGAVVDDLVNGGGRKADVKVDFNDAGDMTIVFTDGNDAVFAEFGAGVTLNGPAGQSPHPLGSELGFTIGDYGYGLGRLRSWRFEQDGQWVETYGTPASMPLYNAVQSVITEIPKIAREVFGA